VRSVDHDHWCRYLDVATDLLALVQVGQLDIDALHDLALAQADLDRES